MNIAIDIDGTITALPEVFRALSAGLRANGHKVYVVTFRLEAYREHTEKELAEMGVQYDELVMSTGMPDPAWKVAVAVARNVGAFFEDAKEVLMLLPPGIQPVWVVPLGLRTNS